MDVFPTQATLLPRRTLRLVGLLYLLVIILAGFSQGYVRGSVLVPGDAAATAANILAQEALFRTGVATDLLAFILDAVISVLPYQWLRPFGKNLVMASAALRLLAHPAIGSLNLLHHYLALHVLTGPEVWIGFGPEQLEALSLLFLDAHRYGYLLAGGLFGVHCVLLGIQLVQSGAVPRLLGILMVGAGVGYLLETFGDLLLPGNEAVLAWVVGLSAALGEVSLTFYLLIKGATKTYFAQAKQLSIS